MRNYRGFNGQISTLGDRVSPGRYNRTAELGFIGPPGAPTVTSGGIPVVAYTSSSGWAARPILATEYYQPPTVVAIPPSADIPPLPPEMDYTPPTGSGGAGTSIGPLAPAPDTMLPDGDFPLEPEKETGAMGLFFVALAAFLLLGS